MCAAKEYMLDELKRKEYRLCQQRFSFRIKHFGEHPAVHDRDLERAVLAPGAVGGDDEGTRPRREDLGDDGREIGDAAEAVFAPL